MMSKRSFHRAILGAGLGGTSAFVLAGVWYMVSRVWADSFTRSLEVMVAAPFMALWVLSPMLWAVRPKRLPAPPAPEGPPLFWGDLLMVGGATVAYLWEFVWRPIFLDLPLETSSLWYILIVPAAQWAILGVFGALGGRG
jgi:hypothetical protein